MQKRVVVIPDDHCVRVGDLKLKFLFEHPAGLHALQWFGDTGSMEFKTSQSRNLTGEDDYKTYVQPFVTVWQAEKARLDAQAAQAESEAEAARAAAEAAYNSLDATRARKLAEIAAAYESVLAYIIAPEGTDNLAAALAVADFTADDHEGLAFIRTQLKTRRAELEAAVAAAPDAAAVEAVDVGFAV